jgi:hypothetical protein
MRWKLRGENCWREWGRIRERNEERALAGCGTTSAGAGLIRWMGGRVSWCHSGTKISRIE